MEINQNPSGEAWHSSERRRNVGKDEAANEIFVDPFIIITSTSLMLQQQLLIIAVFYLPLQSFKFFIRHSRYCSRGTVQPFRNISTSTISVSIAKFVASWSKEKVCDVGVQSAQQSL